jgi:DNA-binding beta-propeller fold protein YncE
MNSNYKHAFAKLNTLMAVGLILGLAACAAPQATPVIAEDPVEESPAETVWPAPPEQAVIRYLSEIRNLELPEKKQKKRFQDILGGEEETKKSRTLIRPFAVTTDMQGRIFVGDAELHSVVVYNANGKYLGEWGTAGIGNLATPLALAADRSGNLYVSDTEQNRIVVFDPDGNFLNTFGGKDVLQFPAGIAINNELGRIYVTDSRAHSVIVFNMDGEQLFTIAGPFGEKEGGFFFPISIDIDEQGNLWVVDSMNFRIVNLDAEGNYIQNWGKLGNQLGQFSRPKGITLDKDGNVYVSDVAFSNIQIFDQQGNLLMFFGEAGGGPMGFSMPANLHFDQNNRLYVADQRNRRIKIFEYLGAPDIPDEEVTDTKSDPGN